MNMIILSKEPQSKLVDDKCKKLRKFCKICNASTETHHLVYFDMADTYCLIPVADDYTNLTFSLAMIKYPCFRYIPEDLTQFVEEKAG